MSTKREAAMAALTGPQAPGILTPETVNGHLSGQNIELSAPYLSAFLDGGARTGDFLRIRRGLYLNLRRRPRPDIAEAGPFIRQGAILSLQTVLGRTGVHNNPTPWMTFVVPRREGNSRLGASTVTGGGTCFRFATLPAAMFPSPGDNWYDLAFQPSASTPTATREKALLDWLVLGNNHRSRLSLPVRGDIDLDMLDEDRLIPLADAMGVRHLLDTELMGIRQKIDRRPRLRR